MKWQAEQYIKAIHEAEEVAEDDPEKAEDLYYEAAELYSELSFADKQYLCQCDELGLT